MCLQKETLQQEVWQQTQPVAQTLQGTILLQMQSSYAVVLHPCAGMQVLQSQQIHPAECVFVSGPVVRPTDETRARCFTNGYLRIQHDHKRCNGIEMISSLSLNKSSLFRHFMLCAV